MGCNSCGAAKNLLKAGVAQPNKIAWLVEGVGGILKSAAGAADYTDSDIATNRDVCRECEYATKNTEGRLNALSQCMAPDPDRGNAPCGCLLIAKTEVGNCPLGKWTTIKISASKRV